MEHWPRHSPEMLRGALLLALFQQGQALDNGLARKPPMGYNTWYDVTGDFDEALLLKTVDAFMSLKLPEFGYTHWNLDDLWSGGRYPNGSIYADPKKFPSRSLRPLCDYVHSKKLPDGTPLLCGAYSDRGTKHCGPGPGSFNHTTKDANSFAAWAVDYLKEDSCAASQNHATAYAEYGRMRDALNATGRKIVFSLCCPPKYCTGGVSNPDPALSYGGGTTLGNLWRIGPDDTNWAGVITNINLNAPLAKNAGPGGWNDPCLLLAEDWQGNLRVTQLQSRAQFSMWAVMASPLVITHQNPTHLRVVWVASCLYSCWLCWGVPDHLSQHPQHVQGNILPNQIHMLLVCVMMCRGLYIYILLCADEHRDVHQPRSHCCGSGRRRRAGGNLSSPRAMRPVFAAVFVCADLQSGGDNCRRGLWAAISHPMREGAVSKTAAHLARRPRRRTCGLASLAGAKSQSCS